MDRVLRIADDCSIDSSLVQWRFDTSSGPGGQHANRSNTRVEATLPLAAVDGPEWITQRLADRYGTEIRVTVDTTRSQTRNREIALDRIEERLAAALERRKTRRQSKPSKASKRRRVESKRRRSAVKRGRQRPGSDD